MARTPKVINVGKTFLVYEGEEYRLKGERVVKHVRDRNLPARKKKDVRKVVAVYSEILHNDLTVDFLRQMMDKPEIDQFIAKARRKKRKVSELSLRQAAKAEAILKTEFHSLDATEPPANPLFKTRSLALYKFFLFLSPFALYLHAAIGWQAINGDLSGWPGLGPESSDWWVTILIAVYAAVLIAAWIWPIRIVQTIRKSGAISTRIPSLFYYFLAVVIPAGGSQAHLFFPTEGFESTITVIGMVSLVVGLLLWLLFIVRFFLVVGRLVGQTFPYGFIPALPFIFLPPLGHISILYYQRYLNILDKNKMNFLV